MQWLQKCLDHCRKYLDFSLHMHAVFNLLPNPMKLILVIYSIFAQAEFP